MADRSKTIIIKKIKKNHGGHHGGSWKVAYADFVTAMMAFFLLLWLLTMTSSEKRAVLAQYFKNFSLFKESGTSFMSQSSQVFEHGGGDVKSTSAQGKENVDFAAEALKGKLKGAVDNKLSATKKQILVDIFEGGVRIQIVDSEGNYMFQPGSAEPTERALEILKIVAENIREAPNRIAIEGHTDTSPTKKGNGTNWELSAARATAARRVLEKFGMNPAKVSKVVGYAGTEPLFKDDPTDPRNRRISLILLKPRPEDFLPPPVPEMKIQPPAVLPPEEKTPVEKPAVKKPVSEPEAGPDLGVKPNKPIDIIKPIDIPGVKLMPQVKNGPPAAKPAPAATELPKLQFKPRPAPKPQHRQVERPAQAPKKQEQPAPASRKDKVDIRPLTPFEKIIPEIGK